MTTRYVGPGGNDANNGTSWATRKLTLNGVEDTPVAAGDLVYVAPGTYRETLTLDVSGSGGSPIEYRADYTGANTDGVGGIVRITGSDNDTTATRANCITCTTQRNYRTFTGFLMSLTTGPNISGGTNIAGTNWIINKCSFYYGVTAAISITGANQSTWSITNCYFSTAKGVAGIIFSHSSVVDNSGHTVENCIADIGYDGNGVQDVRVGGIVIRNCLFRNGGVGVYVQTALNVGQTMTVNNCVLTGMFYALRATTTAEFSEDYNAIFGVNTARTNVNTGANSNVYPYLFDSQWFSELTNGGRMLTPFDMTSYCGLVNLAGTSPTTTDMRNTSAIGGQREWGALEYDATLLKAGAAAGGMLQANKRGNKQ